MDTPQIARSAIPGRGATFNPANRFESAHVDIDPDLPPEKRPDPKTTHVPGKKERVLGRLSQMRGGKLYDSQWGKRMSGKGVFARQIEDLFNISSRRAGLSDKRTALTTGNFRRPSGAQLEFAL